MRFKKTCILTLSMSLTVLASAGAFSAENKKAVAVTAMATMEQPYHQVTALFVEYPEEVCI